MATKMVYFSNSGAPATGLTLSWNGIKKVSDGTAFTPQPTFTEIGNGWYKFDINPSEKLVGVIDGSATITAASERYQPVYFDKFDFIYEVFVVPVYDEDSDALRFLAFMVQNGVIISSGITNVSITVYNSSHASQFTISGTTITNGVCSLTKSTPGLTKNLPYYVTASFTYNGVVYDSVDTFLTIE